MSSNVSIKLKYAREIQRDAELMQEVNQGTLIALTAPL